MPPPNPPLPYRQPPVPAPWLPPEVIEAQYQPARPHPPAPGGYLPPSPIYYPPAPYPEAGYPPPAYPPPHYYPAPARRGIIGRLLRRLGIAVLAVGAVLAVLAVVAHMQAPPPPWFAGSWVAQGGGVPQLELSVSGNQISGRLIVNHPDRTYRMALPILYAQASNDAVLFHVEDSTALGGTLLYLASARTQPYLVLYEGPGLLSLYRVAHPPHNRPYTASLMPIVSAQQRLAVLVPRHRAGVIELDPNPQQEQKKAP